MSLAIFINKILTKLEEKSSSCTECAICYDNITDVQHITYSPCCRSVFHKSCYSSAKECATNKYECLSCETQGTKMISATNALFPVIAKLTDHDDTGDIDDIFYKTMSELCLIDPEFARMIDNEIRSKIGHKDYVTYIHGLFPLSSTCLSYKKKTGHTPCEHNHYEEGDLITTDMESFKRRWNEFTHGIFDTFEWPEHTIATGIPMLGLIGKNNYKYLVEPTCSLNIHFLVYKSDLNEAFKTTRKIFHFIESKLDGLSGMTLTHNTNTITGHIDKLDRKIHVEMVTYRDLFNTITKYSRGRYEYCQIAYDGKNVLMTVKAMMSLMYQCSYLRNGPVRIKTKEIINHLGYDINAHSFIADSMVIQNKSTHSTDINDLEHRFKETKPFLLVEMTKQSAMRMKKIIVRAMSDINGASSTNITYMYKYDCPRDIITLGNGVSEITYTAPHITSKFIKRFVEEHIGNDGKLIA